MRILPISRFVIEGPSMLPTLKPKSSVITFNWHYLFIKPKAGDLVVAEVSDRILIKRIKKLDSNKYFLQGDNEKESTDSRSFGWITKSQIIAKVIYVLS